MFIKTDNCDRGDGTRSVAPPSLISPVFLLLGEKVAGFLAFIRAPEILVQSSPARKPSTFEPDTHGIPLIYSVSYCASELNPAWPSQKVALPRPLSLFLSLSPFLSLSLLPARTLHLLRLRRSLYKFHESFEPYIFSLSSRFARHVLLKYDNFTRRSPHPRPAGFVLVLFLGPVPPIRHPGGFPFPLFHGFRGYETPDPTSGSGFFA